MEDYKFEQKFRYLFLLQCKNSLKDKNSFLYKNTKLISDSIPNQHHPVANNVYRMVNSWYIERKIIAWINGEYDYDARFFNEEDHEFYHGGPGKIKEPDLILGDGKTTIEIKSWRCRAHQFKGKYVKSRDLHNGTYLFFYDRRDGYLYQMDPEDGSIIKQLAFLGLDLPFNKD